MIRAPKGQWTAMWPELQLAIYQHGYTVAAVGHLSGISRERLVALLAGAEPTQQERETLQRLLANWRPGF